MPSTTAAADTLFENDAIRIERASSKGADGVMERGPEDRWANSLVLMLEGGMRGRDTPDLKRGDFAVMSRDASEVEVARGGASWLSINFNGDVKEGSFPSPDLEALRRIKGSLKRNIRSIPQIEALAESPAVRVERIVAEGFTRSLAECAASMNQFVMVMEGEAHLVVEREISKKPSSREFSDKAPFVAHPFENEHMTLGSGDYIVIPAHTKGAVAGTKEDGKTVMLSVYFGGKLTD